MNRKLGTDEGRLGNAIWSRKQRMGRSERAHEAQAFREDPGYIKAYTSVMLEIKDMSDEDRLYHFMKGL